MKTIPKILIVDDLLENLISLEAILDDLNVELIRAFSGQEALRLCSKEDFALVILDVQMPEMNGYETLELLRQRKKTKYLQVIFVSAIHRSDLNIIRGIETGAIDFIPKPIVPEILKGKVAVFLDLYRQRTKLNNLIIELEETNLNLKNAKNEAEEALRTKSRFLANMTHEIRTPLNGVIGLSRMLQKSELNAEQQEWISIITTSGENLLKIINDILDFSKNESGQIVLENIDFEINGLLKNVYKLMKFKADESGLDFSYHLSKEVPAIVNGDPFRISQILMNLVNNAIKFTQKGHVKLIVELDDQTKDSIRILFRIKDTGIGISEEGKSLLFKEFSQAESSTSRKYGGTGLGLIISKNMVELMHGEIGVESEINKGSEFWFKLSLREAQNIKDETPVQTEVVPKDLKILLAEDNIINQRVAILMLKQFGLKCDVAKDGMEAFNLYKSEDYELVLMDMQMPNVDGMQSTAMIRSHEREHSAGHPIYIVALTANAMAEDKYQCLQSGMNNYLCKPATEKDFRKILIEAGKHRDSKLSTNNYSAEFSSPAECISSEYRNIAVAID
jgi:signal transduction histidine kinase